MKIGILGLGGIGSFIGAKLTEGSKRDSETEIIFICRDKIKEAIKNKGLSLSTEDQTITSKPSLASDQTDEIGLLDVLIVSTKSFSLAKAVKNYQNCLKKDTVIIPLQNGVNAKTIIEKSINHDSSKILEGCIYVASNIEKPGVVKHVGGPGKIFFGNNNKSDFEWLEETFKKAGLNATYTQEIKKIVWKKYLFVSPVAAMTTALDITFGQLAESSTYRDKLKEMMKEVKNLAAIFKVNLTESDVEDSLSMLSNFPYNSKSSLQLDFENKYRNTEQENLVGFVVQNGKEFGINVENYKTMNEKINSQYT